MTKHYKMKLNAIKDRMPDISRASKILRLNFRDDIAWLIKRAEEFEDYMDEQERKEKMFDAKCELEYLDIDTRGCSSRIKQIVQKINVLIKHLKEKQIASTYFDNEKEKVEFDNEKEKVEMDFIR